MKKSKIYNDDPIAFKTLMQMKTLENYGFKLKRGVEFNRVYEAIYNALKDADYEPATPESTTNWQKVGDKDKFMEDVRGKKSDGNDDLNERYASIVNERKDNVVNDWVSVEDELPPEGGMAITVRDTGDRLIYETGEWTKQDLKYMKMNNITHWQPFKKYESQPKK